MHIARPSYGVNAKRSCLLTYLAPLIIGFVVACGEDPTTPVVSDDRPDLSATSTAAALTFYQMSAGGEHSCGVTTDNRAYCWGSNSFIGQLGDGTTTDRSRPVATAGGLRFRQISAGRNSTCGVTTDYRAYCWGYNGYAQLGDGTTEDRLTPTPVAGGIRFAQVEVGSIHACGVSYPEKRVYCWGANYEGQVGDGTTTRFRLTPVPVAGAPRRFRQVSAGVDHTCGVTTDNQAFCWGSNRYGQVGDRSELTRRTPTPVADGHQFMQLDAGDYHNCAVTTDHRAFCWGYGRNGEIGNGKKYLSFWPRPVAGGLRFDRVTGGSSHTCGETTVNQVYCWGTNYGGQLGDGTTTNRLTPVAVAGGLHFAQASAGSGHTCARTAEAKGYCWGTNYSGELGDGSKTERHKPVAVAGPM